MSEADQAFRGQKRGQQHESYEGVAIRTLPVVTGGGCRVTAGQSFFGFTRRAVTLSQGGHTACID